MSARGCASCDALARLVAADGVTRPCEACGVDVARMPDGRLRSRVRAERELDLLGRWLPAIEGTAIPLPTGDQFDTYGMVDRGRPDGVDERSHEMYRAARALRLLDAVAAASPEGPLHVLVLAYAFVVCGPGTRAHYNGARIKVDPETGVADNDETDAASGDGFARRVGMMFAEPVTLAAWFDGSPAQTKAAAVVYGTRLLEDAVAAIEELPPDARLADHDRRRVNLPKLRAILSRLERDLNERLAAFTSTRAVRSTEKRAGRAA